MSRKFLNLNVSYVCVCVCVCVKLLQLCATLCDPVDYSPPGFSVRGILQARILEWIAMPSSRGSSWPRDGTHVSYVPALAGRVFTTSATWQQDQSSRNWHSGSETQNIFLLRWEKPKSLLSCDCLSLCFDRPHQSIPTLCDLPRPLQEPFYWYHASFSNKIHSPQVLLSIWLPRLRPYFPGSLIVKDGHVLTSETGAKSGKFCFRLCPWREGDCHLLLPSSPWLECHCDGRGWSSHFGPLNGNLTLKMAEQQVWKGLSPWQPGDTILPSFMHGPLRLRERKLFFISAIAMLAFVTASESVSW